MTTTTLLDGLIEPLAECLTLESARKIAALRLDEAEQARLDVLADKANRGALSTEEKAEYDGFLGVYHVITLVQARARRLLRG